MALKSFGTLDKNLFKLFDSKELIKEVYTSVIPDFRLMLKFNRFEQILGHDHLLSSDSRMGGSP